MFKINKMKNFYGIKEFKMGNQNEFRRVNLIFAPNGTCKTSLFKGLEDIQFERLEQIQDRVTGKEADFEIEFMNRKIQADDILTFDVSKINSIDSTDMFNIIINPSIVGKMNDIKSFVAATPFQTLLDDEMFTYDKPSYFENCKEIYDIYDSQDYKDFKVKYNEVKKVISKIKYDDLKKSDVFNADVQENIKKVIDIKNYEIDLLKSNFNISDVNNASNFIEKFYDSGHSMKIKCRNGVYKELFTLDEFNTLFDSEKEYIENNIVKESVDYDKLYKTLRNNAKNRSIREHIESDISSVDLYTNPKIFFLLHEYEEQLSNIDYKKLFDGLLDILHDQKQYDDNFFEESVKKFNERFFDYIKIKLNYGISSMYGYKEPKIDIKFYTQNINGQKLTEISSRGEKGAIALFLLVHQLEMVGTKEKVLVIDDESEVFDYAFKHSFVEYISQIAASANIHIILLSHNFDFLRTLSRRLYFNNNQQTVQYMNAYKNEKQEIELCKIKNFTELHLDQFTEINQDNLMIHIVLRRNIEEFNHNKTDFNYLTSFLHFKAQTSNLLLSDLKEFFKKHLDENAWKIDETKTKNKYIDFVYEKAEKIAKDKKGQYNLFLESKVTLAIACRLKFEEKFIDPKKSYNENQTRMIFEDLTEYEKIEYAEINIIIPDFVHLNAFAYEPLMDIKIDRLINLYNKLK